MQVNYIQPRKELRGVISRFWIGEVLSMGHNEQSFYRIIASGNTGLIIQLFQNQSLLLNSADHRVLPKAFIYGQKSDSPCLNHFTAEATLLGVDFHPTVFKKVFGVNATELTNTLADAVALLPYSLIRQMQDSESIHEAISLIEHYLLGKVKESSTEAALDYAITQIRQTTYLVDTAVLASKIGMSQRTFQRHFKEQVGIDAYTYSRIVRFQKALHSMQQGREISLTQLAYDLGYADQSHFGREFKLFVGESPLGFIKHSKYLETSNTDIHTPFRIIEINLRSATTIYYE